MFCFLFVVGLFMKLLRENFNPSAFFDHTLIENFQGRIVLILGWLPEPKKKMAAPMLLFLNQA